MSRLLHSGRTIQSAATQALLHCMILLSTNRSSPQNGRYEAVKLVTESLTRQGQYSVEFLASYTMLSIYEIAQAFYPEAYNSVSTCVRICHIFGLHDRRKATQLFAKAGKHFERQEQSRVFTADESQIRGWRWKRGGAYGGAY